MDDKATKISAWDQSQVILDILDEHPGFAQLVRIRPTKPLEPLRKYQIIVHPGFLIDQRGKDFKGISTGNLMFTTALGRKGPLGWRVVAEPDSRINWNYWKVCSMQFYINPGCPNRPEDKITGTPSSSNNLDGTGPSLKLNEPIVSTAACAFSGDACCWEHNATLPGAWIGFYMRGSWGAYARSFQITGTNWSHPGAPQRVQIQFYYDGLWKTLEERNLTEECTNLTWDYQATFGPVLDTVGPYMNDIYPPSGEVRNHRTQRFTLTFTEEIFVLRTGNQPDDPRFHIVEAGNDFTCGTDDDTFYEIPTRQTIDAELGMVADGTAPKVVAQNRTIIIELPHYVGPERTPWGILRYYCLDIDEGAVTDRVGNAWRGIDHRTEDYKFQIAPTPDGEDPDIDTFEPYYVGAIPPKDSYVQGDQPVRITILLSEHVALVNPNAEAVFVPDCCIDYESDIFSPTYGKMLGNISIKLGDAMQVRLAEPMYSYGSALRFDISREYLKPGRTYNFMMPDNAFNDLSRHPIWNGAEWEDYPRPVKGIPFGTVWWHVKGGARVRAHRGHPEAVPAFLEQRELDYRVTEFDAAEEGMPAYHARDLFEGENGTEIGSLFATGWDLGKPWHPDTIGPPYPGYAQGNPVTMGPDLNLKGAPKKPKHLRHFLRITSLPEEGGEANVLEVPLSIAAANTPAQVRVLEPLQRGFAAGEATLIRGLSVDDDNAEMLHVEITVEPPCELDILDSAWHTIENATISRHVMGPSANVMPRPIEIPHDDNLTVVDGGYPPILTQETIQRGYPDNLAQVQEPLPWQPTWINKAYGVSKHTEEVLPNYDDAGLGDTEYLTGRPRTASVFKIRGYAFQVRAALSNMTLKPKDNFNGFALVGIQVRDGEFIAEGHLVVEVIGSQGRSLSVRNAYKEDPEKPAQTAIAGVLLEPAALGCHWLVEDGGGALTGPDVYYAARVSSVENGDCSEVAFSSCATTPPAGTPVRDPQCAGMDASPESHLVKVMAGVVSAGLATAGLEASKSINSPARSPRAADDFSERIRPSLSAFSGDREGGTALWLNATDLELLNYHLGASLRWRPCNCPQYLPTCTQKVSIEIERRRTRYNGEEDDVDRAISSCDIPVVVPMYASASLKGPALEVVEDSELPLHDRFHVLGTAPGYRVRIALKAAHGHIISGPPGAEPPPCNRTGCGATWEGEASSFNEIGDTLATSFVRYMSLQNRAGGGDRGIDEVELTVEALLPDRLAWVLPDGFSTIKKFYFEVNVHPAADTPIVNITSLEGHNHFVAGTPAHLAVSIVHLDIDPYEVVRIHVGAPFGNLSFHLMDDLMDTPLGGITEMIEDDATLYAERAGGYGAPARFESEKSGFTIVGTLSALRQVLSDFTWTAPYISPSIGSITATLLQTPNVVAQETSQPPGMFDTSAMVSKAEFAYFVSPVPIPQYACFIWGPSAIFITPDDTGDYVQALNLRIVLEPSRSEQMTAYLAAANYSYRVSVSIGELSIRGVGAGPVGIFAPALQVCPPQIHRDTDPMQVPRHYGCLPGEAMAFEITGTMEEAANVLAAMRYTPPPGFSGQDVLKLSASCARTSLEVALNPLPQPREPIIQCENSTIVLRRGAFDMALPPCRLWDIFDKPPAVVQVRITTSMGILALVSLAGLYFDRDIVPTQLLHNESSQLLFAGPIGLVTKAFASKLVTLHVPEKEPEIHGQIVINVLDPTTNLSASWTGTLIVDSAVVPLLELHLSAPNSTHYVGGLSSQGTEVTVPPMEVTSSAPASPCIIHLQVPEGELRVIFSSPFEYGDAEWFDEGHGSYKVVAKFAHSASELLGALRYKIPEENLAYLPKRVPLRITAYSLLSADTTDVENATARDTREVYIELLAQPVPPELRAEKHVLDVQRGHTVSLSSLGLELLHPRHATVRMRCGACLFSEDEEVIPFGFEHMFTGPSQTLTQHMNLVEIRVTCSLCVTDTIVIHAWDPEFGGDGSGTSPDDVGPEGGYFGVDEKTPTRKKILRQLIIQVRVHTSEKAKQAPTLSVLSKGYIAVSGLPLNLAGSAVLIPIDPNEPMGLRAVEGLVDVVVWCNRGTVAMNTALVAGAWDAPVSCVHSIPDSKRFGVELCPGVPEDGAENDSNGSYYTRNTSLGFFGGVPARGRPREIIRRGRIVRLRAPAADASLVLNTLVYTPDLGVDGTDKVTVAVGGQRFSIPVYIRRVPGSFVIVAPPMQTVLAGETIRSGIIIEADPTIKATDGYNIRVSCGHCRFALWTTEVDLELLDNSISMSLTMQDARTMFNNLTYVPDQGFVGVDRLSVEMVAHKLQANVRSTPRGAAMSAIFVKSTAAFAPPATIYTPHLFTASEMEPLDMKISLHGTRAVAASGIPLQDAAVSAVGHCFRIRYRNGFVLDTLAPAPCDMFNVIGSAPEGEECQDCRLRLTSQPDQCVTWEGGMQALMAGRPDGGWALSTCQTNGSATYATQSFKTRNNWTTFCIDCTELSACTPTGRTEFCVDAVGLTVKSELYRGAHTPVYGGTPLNCSGRSELLGFGGRAAEKCNGFMRCDYEFDTKEFEDPAPRCDKELVITFQCPNGELMEVIGSATTWQTLPLTVIVQCPIPLLPSTEPVALRGALPNGTFEVRHFWTLQHARHLTECPANVTNAIYDTTPPLLTDAWPAADAVTIPQTARLIFTFSENVRLPAGLGRAYLKEIRPMHRPPAAKSWPSIIKLTLQGTFEADRARWEDMKFLLTFQAGGCPNPEPEPSQFASWRAMTDPRVWQDMFTICQTAANSGPLNRDACCGTGNACAPICVKQTSWTYWSAIIATPVSRLAPLTTYEIFVDRGTVEDMHGNTYEGLSGHRFTTGLGELLPTAWRILAEAPSSESERAKGWQIAEFGLYADSTCSGERIRGTPGSNRALKGHALMNNTDGALLPGVAGYNNSSTQELPWADRSAASLAFDGDLNTYWIGMEDLPPIAITAPSRAPPEDGTSAWLALYVDTPTPFRNDSNLTDRGLRGPSAGAALKGTRVRSMQILIPGAEQGGQGEAPAAFSVQFYLEGPGKWYILQTVPNYYGNTGACLTIPADLDGPITQKKDSALPLVSHLIMPSGDDPVIFAVEFDESVKLGFGFVRLRPICPPSHHDCNEDNGTDLTVIGTDLQNVWACPVGYDGSANTTSTLPGAGECIWVMAEKNIAYFDFTQVIRWPGLDYKLEIQPSLIRDVANNLFYGFFAETAVVMSTVAPTADTRPPLLLITSPKNLTANVSAATAIIFTFSEKVKETGIRVDNATSSTPPFRSAVILTPDDGPAMVFAIGGTFAQVVGRKILVTPEGGLPPGRIVVTIAGSSVHDMSGNAFAGVPPGAYQFYVREPAALPEESATEAPDYPLEEVELQTRPRSPGPIVPPMEEPTRLPSPTPHPPDFDYFKEEYAKVSTWSLRPRPPSVLRDLGNGKRLNSFCIAGPAFALEELVVEMRYRSAEGFFGPEIVRMAITDMRDPSVVHSATQTTMLVEEVNHPPILRTAQKRFKATIGSTIDLSPVTVFDPEGYMGTTWMSLSVAASEGNVYLKDTYMVDPVDTIKPIAGRLDGESSLQVQGNLVALQGFMNALQFGKPAPMKPFLNLKPLDRPVDEVYVTYIVSDSIDTHIGAINRHAIVGAIVDPRNGNLIPGVEVSIDGPDGFHRYLESTPGGTYSVIMPQGEARMSFYKYNFVRQDKTIFVDRNIPMGSIADIYLSPLGVVNLWKVELNWHARGDVPVDLDAHLYDMWNCHTYFTRFNCSHSWDISGLEVTLDRDFRGQHVDREEQRGRETMSMVSWPCYPQDTYDPIEATQTHGPGRVFRDIRNCYAHYWVQMYSLNSFADVDACVTIYLNERLVSNITLAKDDDPDRRFWAGIRFDFHSLEVTALNNEVGDSAVAEAMLDGMELRGRRRLQENATTMQPPKTSKARPQGGRRLREEQLRKTRRTRGPNRGEGEEGVEEEKRTKPAWLEGVMKEAKLSTKHLQAGGEWTAERAEMDARRARQLSEGPQDEDGPADRRLMVEPPVGSYNSGPMPLANSAMFFTPNENKTAYTSCRLDLPPSAAVGAHALPDPPKSWARRLPLLDDEAVPIEIVGGFNFFGQLYTEVYVSANGYVTFGRPSPSWGGGADQHFQRTGISALFIDLVPLRGGTVYYEVVDDDGDERVLFTWDRVRHVSTDLESTFQIALFLQTGGIRLAWGAVAAAVADDATLGVSPGVFGHLREDLLTVPDCIAGACGNGNRTHFEACDDGNLVDGDGCSAGCLVESGFHCIVRVPGHNDICKTIRCGDGHRHAPEECDDRNTRPGDGCSSDCRIEAGYACSRGTARHSDVCWTTGPAATQIFGDTGATLTEAGGSPFDLVGTQLVFTPLQSPASGPGLGYRTCRTNLPAGQMMDFPSVRARRVLLEDDYSLEMYFADGFMFPFFGKDYLKMYLGSNGFITFNQKDFARLGRVAPLEKHFGVIRISALLSDLNPQAGGTVYFEHWETDTNHARAVITFVDVPQFGRNDPNTFQVALYADGRIRMSWMQVSVTRAVVGVSPGYRPSARSLRLQPGGFVKAEAPGVRSAMDRFCRNLGTDDDVVVGSDDASCNNMKYARHHDGLWKCFEQVYPDTEDEHCLDDDAIHFMNCTIPDDTAPSCERDAGLLAVAAKHALGPTARSFYGGDFTWEAWYYRDPNIQIGENASASAIISNFLDNQSQSFVGVYAEADDHILVSLKEGRDDEDVIIHGRSSSPMPQSWVHIALVVKRATTCHIVPDIAESYMALCSHVTLYLNRVRNAEWRAVEPWSRWTTTTTTEDNETFNSSNNTSNNTSTSSTSTTSTTTTLRSTIPFYYNSHRDLRFGGGAASPHDGAHGNRIGRVRIWNRALTAPELGRCSYSAGNALAVTGLVLSADLDGSFVESGAGVLVEPSDAAKVWFMDSAPPECMDAALATEGLMKDLSHCANCVATCGDARRDAGEACDDGNTDDGDGCSSTCTLETGYYCFGGAAPSDATPLPDTCENATCGDGVAQGAEQCDDGNLRNADGCSVDCLVEAGWVCTGDQPSVCETVCGDGAHAGSEECDDGGLEEGDGCSSNCTVEDGWFCEGGTAYGADTCHTYCGDGLRIFEECDDGNSENGDGCDSLCHVEDGWACSGGSRFTRDVCDYSTCGDGMIDEWGGEECDDHNNIGGDGCSANCKNEDPAPVLTAELQVMVDMYMLPQACRIANEMFHSTQEDTPYHLKYTTLSGDGSEDGDVRVRIRVTSGNMTVGPLLKQWKEQGKTDAVPQAIVQRELGVVFEPYETLMSDTVLSGSAFNVDRFMRLFIFLEPQPDFVGYMSIDFEVLEGITLSYGAKSCQEVITIRVEPNFNDLPEVRQIPDLAEYGFNCVEGDTGCKFEGLSVYDPDCAQVPDGSCYMRVTISVTEGSLTMAGRSPEPGTKTLPEIVGHDTGVNAALQTLVYIPPALPFGSGRDYIVVKIERVLARSAATPAEIFPFTTEGSVRVNILERDTPPSLMYTNHEAFHASLIRVRGAKPFTIDTLVFEPPGAHPNAAITTELTVSSGGLFIGEPDGLFFENDTAPGDARLNFRKNGTETRRYLRNIRYTWDDDTCTNLEQFNFTFNDQVHPPWTLSALLELPDCPAFSLSWHKGTVEVDEDGQVVLDNITIRSYLENIFVKVDVRHPRGVPGDCQTVYWPNDVRDFVRGRECHLDGTIPGLRKSLPHVVYRPPPEFSGDLELEVVVQRVRLEDEVVPGFEGPHYPPQSIFVPLRVKAVNDIPSLRVDQESQSMNEDVEATFLSPLFVSDIDAGSHNLSFYYQITTTDDFVGNLFMCGLGDKLVDKPFNLDEMGGLDDFGCLPSGVVEFRFHATVEQFNAMQWNGGRLKFKPAPQWHGAVMINITVDDLGSGLGPNASLQAWRSLHLVIEPVADEPRLLFHCRQAEPLTSFGRACLEVKDCLELSAEADEEDKATSMVAIVTASDPGIAIAAEDSAPVYVQGEGTSRVQVSGIWKNVRDYLRILYLRPPPYLFMHSTDNDSFPFDIHIQAYALGQQFGNPLPKSFEGFPTASVSFSGIYHRVNRAPYIFVSTSHFSSSQLDALVDMPGISVTDPDMKPDEMMEITLEVSSKTGGGALEFAGVQDRKITRRLPLHEVNRELQSLRLFFQDRQWFGVTGVHMSISDLGNRGYSLRQYDDMYHRDTRPQVLTLRGAKVAITPRDTLRYHRLFNRDFTWEVYVKRLLPTNMSADDNTSRGDLLFQNTFGAADVVEEEPSVSIRVDELGHPVVRLRSQVLGGLSFTVGGAGLASLQPGAWHHLAIVVRRRAPQVHTLRYNPSRRSDTTAGDVRLFVDRSLDSSWPLEAPGVHFGPTRQEDVPEGAILDPKWPRDSEMVIEDGTSGLGGGLMLSRFRIWDRALEAGDLGLCDDPHGATDGGPENVRETVPQATADSQNAVADYDKTGLAYSFSFGGTLAETAERAIIAPTGFWSFDVDSPPRCTSLTEAPHDNVMEQCVRYDRSLADVGAHPYVWHSPQAYAAGNPGYMAYANNLVEPIHHGSLTATTFFAVYRKFVNEPPRIRILEPQDGIVNLFEDHTAYFSLEVLHKAEEQQVPRPILVSLGVSHGYLRSLSHSVAVRLDSGDRREVEYRGPLHDVNDFLAQIEYVPDPNYAGPDLIVIDVSDREFVVNATMEVVVSEISDPLTLVCPPAVDLLEGWVFRPIGTNISIHNSEPLPGQHDDDIEVSVELFVGGGHISLDFNNDTGHEACSNDSNGSNGSDCANISMQAVVDTIMSDPSFPKIVDIAEQFPRFDAEATLSAVRFNATLRELRFVLAALRYTPYPKLFHGIVHFGMVASVIATGEQANCDIGIVVHPVNTAPLVTVSRPHFLAATNNRGVVKPHQDIHLVGVFHLSDPDEEDFSDWFKKRVHSARLMLNTTCGTLSFDLLRPTDYVMGAQSGSIAGMEGMTFQAGDGYRDPYIDALSTLDHLNGQLQRLYFHTEACRNETVTIEATIDDLGNYGEGGSLFHQASIVIDVEGF
eukprot:TRINITY_DN39600_c0_g5_i1.p1 TRINITY_DN39600_c0_g5~~TRINITY_DN39600_c0_g5_i1.p1  ORF type:complete len:7063 (+),score=1414.31 TRINITY_DN39600_c0_g5_i1:190-21189(+)